MKHFSNISLDDLKYLHRSNGGFHDAEILGIDVNGTKQSIRILLGDLRKYVGERGLPAPAASEIDLQFGGAILLSDVDPTSIVGYGVNRFSIGERKAVQIETVMGRLEFSFLSVAVAMRSDADSNLASKK
jgi:hypothetical protein